MRELPNTSLDGAGGVLVHACTANSSERSDIEGLQKLLEVAGIDLEAQVGGSFGG